MNKQEAINHLLDQAMKDGKDLGMLLEEYRGDKGIGLSIFVELLASVTQDYRTLIAVTGKK